MPRASSTGLSIVLAAICGLAMLAASALMPEFRHGPSHEGAIIPPAAVSTVAGAPVAGPLSGPEPVQAGERLTFKVPAETFTDPNGEPLTYSAAMATGEKSSPVTLRAPRCLRLMVSRPM